MISTRTPEGEPLKCEVCGSEHLVLSCRPPGDSVCPNCGSHSWIAAPKNGNAFPSTDVLQRVPAFVDKLRLSRSKSEAVSYLVHGLFDFLSPLGVSLWVPSTKGDAHPMQYDLFLTHGETHGMEFASKVARASQPIMRLGKTNFGERLQLGVPLHTKNELRTFGILEITHRPTVSPDARDAYFRFVRTMAAVTTGTRAF